VASARATIVGGNLEPGQTCRRRLQSTAADAGRQTLTKAFGPQTRSSVARRPARESVHVTEVGLAKLIKLLQSDIDLAPKMSNKQIQFEAPRSVCTLKASYGGDIICPVSPPFAARPPRHGTSH